MLRDNSLHSETMHRMLDKEFDVLDVRTADKKACANLDMPDFQPRERHVMPSLIAF